MNFKLLGIRPLLACDARYTKVLNPGQLYPFYQNYRFFEAGGRDILPRDDVTAVLIPDDPGSHLHDLETADGYKLRVNISAVVGRNGSGKSTLMELFFAAVYLVSLSDGILKDTPETLRKELEKLPEQIKKREEKWNEARMDRLKLAEAYSKQFDQGKAYLPFEELAGQIERADLLLKSNYELLNKTKAKEESVRRQLVEMLDMVAQISVELFYQINRTVFCLQVTAKNGEPACQLFRLQEVDQDDLLKPQPSFRKEPLPFAAEQLPEQFFYTIAVNYSHYALNARHMGDWINSLFHKNDGYKTPVVINPMRDDGNFNINKELALGKQRLLSNLLVQRQLKKDLKVLIPLTGQLDVFRVWLTVDPNKVENIEVRLTTAGLAGPKREIGLLRDLFEVFFNNKDFADKLPRNSALVELAINYILEKIESIHESYEGFDQFFLDSEGRSAENRRYFQTLRDEPSHVTFKLKQAVHFLRRLADPDWLSLFTTEEWTFENTSPVIFKPSLESLLGWTGEPDGWEMTNYLPPPIFKIDFELINRDEKTSFFNELSSGEQQMIHTLQTVLYHMNNLQSVRYSGLPRLHYRAINLVFDEIELYFHPAYQRAFINELGKALGRLYVGDEQAIESVNIVFLTHSPFILSDIPQNHITLLSVPEDGAVSLPSIPESQTFAANINELLAGSFFLDGTLMGDFAERKVNELIRAVKEQGQLTPPQQRLLALVGDTYLHNSLQYFLRRKNDQNRTE